METEEATNTLGAGFSVAGSPLTNQLLRVWAEGYGIGAEGDMSEKKPQIIFDDSSAASGAARVCGVRRGEEPVDVAAMLRPMNQLEASTEDGWHFDCVLSTRSTVQVEVGKLGSTIATGAEGPAADCIEKIGGLSFHQLRWMYSSLTESQLADELDGWDRSTTVPFSDGNDATHLWSELHADCEPIEIVTVGPLRDTPVYEYFDDRIFKAQGETFNFLRYNSAITINRLVSIVEMNGSAIGFFNIRYSLSEDDAEIVGTLKEVPVRQQNDGIFYETFLAKFNTGGKYPLVSRLTLNLNDEKESMANIRPFLDHALSRNGTEALLSAGFWPVPEWEQIVMKTRAETASAIPMNHIRWFCGNFESELAIAGSSTVFPIAQLWSAVYALACNSNMTLEGGGSSSGAGRVCGDADRGSPVDIGDMSREWKTSEATASQDLEFLYNCRIGDTGRSAIQIPVAVDGITVAARKEGLAQECIQMLGGLSTDQLRWIFSSYNEEELTATGWDAGSVPNNDRNPKSYLWSELDPRCQPVEIRISGPDDESGTYEFFFETILTDHSNGETLDENHMYGYFESLRDEDLVRYMEERDDAISFFGFSYYFQYRSSLFAVPIKNADAVFVEPSSDTIGDGSYNPLSRNIYMNLLNDATSLDRTRDFVRFGLSTPELMSVHGYLPQSLSVTKQLLDRLERAPFGENGQSIRNSNDRGIRVGLTWGLVASLFAIIVGCAIVADARYRMQWRIYVEECRAEAEEKALAAAENAARKQGAASRRRAKHELVMRDEDHV